MPERTHSVDPELGKFTMFHNNGKSSGEHLRAGIMDADRTTLVER